MRIKLKNKTLTCAMLSDYVNAYQRKMRQGGVQRNCQIDHFALVAKRYLANHTIDGDRHLGRVNSIVVEGWSRLNGG